MIQQSVREIARDRIAPRAAGTQGEKFVHDAGAGPRAIAADLSTRRIFYSENNTLVVATIAAS